MGAIRILVPDDWHFHRRNFPSLFTALAAPGIAWRRERSRRAWWKRHGDYRALRSRLAPHLAGLEALSPEGLVAATHLGIPLAPLALSELLCRLLPRAHWIDYRGPADPASLLRRAAEHDREDLLLNLAAAADWLDFWSGCLDRGGFTHVLAFSGSYIYTRSLLALAERRALPAFVLESFFTGNEFYCEPRYTPISNNSSLGDSAQRRYLALPSDESAADLLRVEAHRRLAAMRNKNVRPRTSEVPPVFPGQGKTLLIVAQVLNDFSLLAGKPEPLFALPFYIDAIRRLLAETDHRIVFKAHPWERKRPNLEAPVTLDRLRRFAASLPPAQQARLRFLEQEPIGALFRQVDWVVTLCSQAALEACQAGLKPAQFGKAFYGGAGFTHDYADLDAFFADLHAGRVSGALTPAEYRAFEDFLAGALVLHLYRGDAASAARLVRLFEGAPSPPPMMDAEQLARPGFAWRPFLRDLLAAPCPWLRDGLRFLRRPRWRLWAGRY